MFRLPPKVVSTLCLLQVLAIVFGYVLTRSHYKVLKLSDSWLLEMIIPRIAWYTKAMLAMGPWLLIVPLAWGSLATITADSEGGIAEVSSRQVCLGYVLSGCIAVFCIGSVLQMMHALWSPL